MAESVLLKTLGIVPMEMVVDDAALLKFEGLFDSPLREQHLRALAAVFGKTMPTQEELRLDGGRELCALA